MLCEYGCGREAVQQFKNGKWCCSKSTNGCNEIKRKQIITSKEIIPKTVINYFGLEICSYGCGQIAKFKMNNGKFCCSDNMHKCPESKRKQSIALIGNKPKLSIEYFGLEICSYGCGQIAKYKMNNGKLCCSKNHGGCPKVKEKNSFSNSGENSYFYHRKQTKEHTERIRLNRIDKKHSPESIKKMSISHSKENLSEETLKKMRISQKFTIEDHKKKYPLFSKIEEMRYNPDKPIEEKEIQVHCKNHNCENSKEKGGWFTPTPSQLFERSRCIEKHGKDNSYFYCSQRCKDTCPLYGSNGNDPYRDVSKPYTDQEYEVWRQQVLKQDNHECQKCGSKENLHCHHIRPIKLEPEYALDPTNGIVLCKDCHIKYGHKVGTECSLSNLAKIICNKKKKGNN